MGAVDTKEGRWPDKDQNGAGESKLMTNRRLNIQN